jgi:hypothetical protein
MGYRGGMPRRTWRGDAMLLAGMVIVHGLIWWGVLVFLFLWEAAGP